MCKNNIEVLLPLLNLEQSSIFWLFVLPSTDNSIHTSYLRIYKYVGHTIHYILTNRKSIKSIISPNNQQIIKQNDSMTCWWNLLWNLYHKSATHLGGLITYLAVGIATLSIRPN